MTTEEELKGYEHLELMKLWEARKRSEFLEKLGNYAEGKIQQGKQAQLIKDINILIELKENGKIGKKIPEFEEWEKGWNACLDFILDELYDWQKTSSPTEIISWKEKQEFESEK